MSDQTLDSLEAGVSQLGIGVPCRTGVGKMRRILFLGFLIALTAAGSCNSETLFKSNFDATAINQPPATQQAVGTVTIDGGVRVAAVPDTSSTKWVRFSHVSGSDVARLHCNLSKAPGDGTYVFSTLLLFPTGSFGQVTIQFEPFGGGEHFLHLDFSPGCTHKDDDDPGRCVRIDDDESTRFGFYPQDQVFIMQVTLNINESPSAHIVLSGAGASGEATRNVSPELRPIARQFGAVRISSGLEADVSTFFATNIVIMRKQ
jgi:hypothetical protein